MMENQNNTILLEDFLKRFKSQNGLTSYRDDEVFEQFTLQQIAKDSDLTFSEIEDSIVDGGQDGGIDSFVILINDQAVSTIEDLDDIKFTKSTNVQILIIQAKISKHFQGKALDKLHISLPTLFDLNQEDQELLKRFNPKLTEKILVMRRVWSQAVEKQSDFKIDIAYTCLANDSEVNEELRSKKEQILHLVKSKTLRIPVTFEFYSAEELLQLYQTPRSTTLPLRFQENPTPIEFNRGQYGYIGVVNLKDYYNFIVGDNGSIREFIFESNVRHYQGEVDVNKGIRDTLENDFSVDFWWLNNGISIIASNFTPYPKVLHLEDVQIVNGLQTSYVIGRSYNPNIEHEKRSILVKVVIVADQDKETIDKIISSSNRQNPVTPAILRATDELQRKLELFFSNKGYYYDRRKNYYKNQGKPTSKIFSIPDVAKAIESILNFNPSEARSRPTSLIKAKKSYQRIFDENKSFDAYLNCCLIHKTVYDFVRAELSGEEKGAAKNFTYHVSRILASILTSKLNYGDKDIASVNIAQIENEPVKQAYELLQQILDEYQTSNLDKNIINIAKSIDFGKAINEKLGDKLQPILSASTE